MKFFSELNFEGKAVVLVVVGALLLFCAWGVYSFVSEMLFPANYKDYSTFMRDNDALIETCRSEPQTVNPGDSFKLYADIHIVNAHAKIEALYQLRDSNRTVAFAKRAIQKTRPYSDSGKRITLDVEAVLDDPGDYSLECSVFAGEHFFRGSGPFRDYEKSASTVRVKDPNIPSSFGSSDESLDNRSSDGSLDNSPRPTINIHGDLTRTYLGGPPIKISLSIVHTILMEQNLTANLIVRVPNGWSLTGSGFAQACTGVCNSVYRLAPGENRPLEMQVVPNESGNNQIYAKVEWVLDDRSDNDIQEATIGVEVYPKASDVPGN